MAKYRKKPIVVEAEVYKEGMEDGFDYIVKPYDSKGGTERVITQYEYDALKYYQLLPNQEVGYQLYKKPYIQTLEGNHYISKGDYIITGVAGERYPCKPDIFEATYEPLESAKTYVCDGCGKAYVREGRKPAKGRKNFCPECGDKASKRLWARKKATEKEKKEEAWNSALPPKICRS
jgi:DNA-directed RNA polymerase subunit RPC12/RpoP